MKQGLIYHCILSTKYGVGNMLYYSKTLAVHKGIIILLKEPRNSLAYQTGAQNERVSSFPGVAVINDHTRVWLQTTEMHSVLGARGDLFFFFF